MENKIKKTCLVFLGLYLLILFKAFYIQVLNKDKLLEYSKSQLIRETKLKSFRGQIFDRNHIPLALNRKTYDIFTIPNEKYLKNGVYREVVNIIPSLSYPKLIRKLKKRKKYTWIRKKIKLNEEQVKKLKKLEGVYLEESFRRYYPYDENTSQVLGFLGYDDRGLAGIEYLYNKHLSGEPIFIKYFKDALGRPVKYVTNSQENVQDLILSIDQKMQNVLMKSLKWGFKKFDPDMIGAGILDVKTGELRAIANYPSFNPNHSKKNLKFSKLSFITDPFEPGSVFKPFVAMAAIEAEVVSPDTVYYCENGRFKVNNHVITEAEKKEKFKWLTVSEILSNSSNIGMAKISFDLTFPTLKTYLNKFNFLNKTGIELPGESRGIFTKKSIVDPLKLSNISFGQGIAVTGIQLLAAFATIANDGIYNAPRIIKGEKIFPKKVIKKDTANIMEKILINAVENGTGKAARMNSLVIAGKTGTAQKPSPKGGYKGFVSSFIGYPVNVKNPFVIFVYLDNPKGKEYYGGQTAAPIFKKIVKGIYAGEKVKSHKNSTNVSVLAHVKGSKNYNRLKIIEKFKKILSSGVMPDFKGLDKKTVWEIFNNSSLDVRFLGVGNVTSQKPRAGVRFKIKNKFLLNFGLNQYGKKSEGYIFQST